MTIYGPQIALAARMIKAYGQIAVLRRVAVEDPNPVTDLPADTSTADQQVAVLLRAPSTMTEQSYASQFASGAMVRSKTRTVTMAGVDVDGAPVEEPKEGDLLLVGADTWRFVGASVVDPDGTAIIYSGTVKR